MEAFYVDTLNELLDDRLTRDMRILVVCGGQLDRDALLHCGFRDVVISNLDDRMKGDEFAPYAWSRQDAENLTYGDDEFDFCIVHSGLHHCRSPHRGMLEMYRVARLGFLLFEPYDNVATRMAVKFQFGQEFEHAAVADNGFTHGGVKNSQIPNYVYRMTKAEIKKSITCYAPIGEHVFRFFHKMRLPTAQLALKRNPVYRHALTVLSPFVEVFGRLFPEQSNNFAAAVFKPTSASELYPWVKREGDVVSLNRDWLEQRYRKDQR